MDINQYFESLRAGLNHAHAVASEARKKNFDPIDEIEVKIAKDVAARVEGIVGPPGVAEVIRSLEAQGISREDISFEIARKIAAGEIIKGTKEQLIEQAVRTGLGILTEGVLVAPTEGIAKIRIKKNPDGSDYVAVYYAGPIRSAGGTAAALSLVLADIARRVCGVGDYRATETQVMRILEEIITYETRCIHLQYLPSEEHQRIIIEHCPVCVDGEPTEDIEVSAYRNVPGIETNRVRSGVALVVCDGLALKAAKLLKITKKLKLNWEWLEKIIKVKIKEDKIEIKPDSTYLEGLVAGRPVFSHPSAKGGFRLRYGRCETNGLMARAIHPATMLLLDNFLAYGTHMKVERPGKGCVVSAHKDLEPPVVKLKNGRVMKVRTIEEAHAIKSDIEEILFLGDILTTYGDFLKSNHPLLPSGYCEEWWQQEIEAKGLTPPSALDAQLLIEFSKTHSVPVHPRFTYHWHDISAEQLKSLTEWLKKGILEKENEKIKELKLPIDSDSAKVILEKILLEHRIINNFVVVGREDAYALLASLGALKLDRLDQPDQIDLSNFSNFEKAFTPEKTALEIINSFLFVRPKAPTYIGGRMGRPEKAKERTMEGSPAVLFPTGSFKNRSVSKQYRTVKTQESHGSINLELIRLRCIKCGRLYFYKKCDVCSSQTLEERICTKCGRAVNTEIHCDVKTVVYDKRPVEIVEFFENIKTKLGFAPDEVKGVKGLTNVTRIPERLEKGFIRSKYGIYVFRDGTSRFDATDIPLTHFRPSEIDLTLEKAKELRYARDYLGNPLTRPDQLVPLKHQDIILAKAGAEYLFNVANFIDEILVNLYGMNAFYNLKKKEDLIGHLAVGLSPHTSAGVLCRIIGFTKANVGYGHPYFHAAKRRNCFHPTTKIVVIKKMRENGRSIEGPSIDEPLGDIIERSVKENPDKIKTLSDGTLKIEVDEELYVKSIYPKNLSAEHYDASKKKIIERKVKCFLKTTSPDYWVKLTVAKPYTSDTLEMIVTPDHNILCYLDGKLKAFEANEVRVGMAVPFDMSGYSSSTIISWQGLVGSALITKVEKILDQKSAYCLDIETETSDILEKNVLLENGIFCIRCDGDEDSIMLLMDALLNFSRHYLSEARGGTMDTPLVLSLEINPKEVDDEAHDIEFVSKYSLEFYQAAEKITPPSAIKIKTVKDVLGTAEQYELPISHPGSSVDKGNIRTTYVTLQSIPDKINTQFSLQERLRPVDKRDAAERLILSHFIPDLYGNLRSFSRQTFRCVSCNTIFRRVPLAGKCIKCGGNLLLTINKGGIQKYLEISNDIVKRYDLPQYLKQRLELIENEIKSIFEDEKIKQTGLADFL